MTKLISADVDVEWTGSSRDLHPGSSPWIKAWDMVAAHYRSVSNNSYLAAAVAGATDIERCVNTGDGVSQATNMVYMRKRNVSVASVCVGFGNRPLVLPPRGSFWANFGRLS